MTIDEIYKYLKTLSDGEVIQRAETARADLENAEQGTEWQEACFAGLYLYCTEMGRRGLKSTRAPTGSAGYLCGQNVRPSRIVVHHIPDWDGEEYTIMTEHL